jgi:hypothetical protein
MVETKGVKNCHSVPGKSREKGCLQYLESTYRAHSRTVLGYVAPRSKVNEEYVATKMVERWLRKGYSAHSIALMWNGGDTQIKSGVNSYGEPYNTGVYAQKVLAYLTN